MSSHGTLPARVLAVLTSISISLCALVVLSTSAPAAPQVCTLFGPAVTSSTGTTPSGVALGDFNEDGHLDAAVGTSSPSRVSVLLGSGSGTFGAPTTFALPSTPRGLCSADFNHDGILDLAVAVTGNVAVLFGQGSGGVGNGGFGGATSYPTGSNPQNVLALDLNEDGIDDLVVSNSSSNTISVLIGLGSGGTGNGSFAAAVGYATATNPAGLASHDFNADGILDLAVANNNSGSNSVSILLGQGSNEIGNGTLAAAVNYPVGANPTGVATGDFNDDFIIDLAVGVGTGVSILLGNGTGGQGNGTFGVVTTYPAGSSIRHLVVGDFNEDGVRDVAATNQLAAGIVSVIAGVGTAGHGTGTFGSPLSFPVGALPNYLAVEDLNEDGHADLVVGNGGAATLSTLLATCPGGLTTALNLFRPNGGEILWTGAPAGMIWNRGNGVMSARVEISRDGGANWRTIARHVIKKGFTWNATPPLSTQALVRISDDNVGTRSDVSAAPFTICTPFSIGVAATGSGNVIGAATADLNRDGILDLVLARDSLEVQLGNGIAGVGDGTFATATAFAETGLAACRPVLVDMNRDGILDVINGRTSGITVRLGLGANGIWNGGFSVNPVQFGSGNTVDLLPGDFDEDGVPDVIGVNATLGRVVLYRMTGVGGVWTGGATTSNLQTTGGPLRLAGGDFNEDGITDFAVTNGQANTILAYLGQGAAGHGNGTFSLAATLTTPGGPTAIVAGDFDDDGITDLAAACANAVSVYLGPGAGGVGTGLFSERTDIPLPFGFGQLAVTDFDRDGVQDLMALSSTGEVALLHGEVSGLPLSWGTLAVTSHMSRMLVGDFLEDGRPDYLITSSTSSTVTSLATLCAENGGTITVSTPGAVEAWDPGSEQIISWTASASVAAVDVEVSRDGGISFDTVARNVAESSFTWTVTPPGAPEAQVRVVESSTGSRFGVSAPFFRICDLVGRPLVSLTPGTSTDFLLRDFNNDGYLDVAMVTGSVIPQGQVVIIPGQGTGGLMNGRFGPATFIPIAGTGASGLTTGDFDRDGILDLVAATTGGLFQCRGQGVGGVGDGTFSAPVAISSLRTWGARAVDLNEDGILDLVSTDSLGTGISVRIGRGTNGVGTGLFGAGVAYPAAARAGFLTLGDFNEDGIWDVAATSSFSGTPASLYVYLGQGVGGRGDGTFGPVTTYSTTTNPSALTTGDFNDDGITDLAVTRGGGMACLIFFGNGSGPIGDGTFAAPVALPVPDVVTEVAMGDLNGDGIADLATNGSSTGLAILTGNGTVSTGNGTFAPSRSLVAGSLGVSNLRVGDFREDGIPDVMTLSPLQVLPGTCPTDRPTVVTVARPNGGESFVIGTTESMSFARGDGVIASDIDLSRDGGLHWERLAENLTGKGFSWTVTPPATTQALIRVTDTTVRGRTDVSSTVFAIVDNTSGTPVAGGPPLVAALSAAAPNPSAGAVLLTLTAPTTVAARVHVFDLMGRRVRVLHGGELPAGLHPISWDGLTDDGRPAAQGLYFVRADWPGFSEVRKVVRVGG